MSHNTAREGYRKLSERINRFPQGAPPTELLFQILEVLFTPAEAELVALLPIKPFTAETAARLWKKSESEARNILEALASRGMMLDIDSRHGQKFVLPPMAGFFEFSMMRIDEHYDQKLLTELFYQYLNVEEDFVRALFATGETQIGRVFVDERACVTEFATMLPSLCSVTIKDNKHQGVQQARRCSHDSTKRCPCAASEAARRLGSPRHKNQERAAPGPLNFPPSTCGP